MDKQELEKWYEDFKKRILEYGDFSEEEIRGMFEAEMIVEMDL